MASTKQVFTAVDGAYLIMHNADQDALAHDIDAAAALGWYKESLCCDYDCMRPPWTEVNQAIQHSVIMAKQRS